jgi:hypothetical protein
MALVAYLIAQKQFIEESDRGHSFAQNRNTFLFLTLLVFPGGQDWSAPSHSRLLSTRTQAHLPPGRGSDPGRRRRRPGRPRHHEERDQAEPPRLQHQHREGRGRLKVPHGHGIVPRNIAVKHQGRNSPNVNKNIAFILSSIKDKSCQVGHVEF